jgi:hypothetical protein
MKCPKCEQAFSTPYLQSFAIGDFSYVAYCCPKLECRTVINIETDKGEMEKMIVAKIDVLLENKLARLTGR